MPLRSPTTRAQSSRRRTSSWHELLLYGQGAALPGKPKVERDGTTYQGILYQSASGGITPEIFTHAIKNVWGPCYPTCSAEQVVGSLCDAYGYHAYGYHWDKEVLDAMKEEFFLGIMGVPNATGLW